VHGSFGKPGRRNEMQTDLEKLEQNNTILLARYQWLTNITGKLLVMIKHAADVLEEYEKQVSLIGVELNKTKQVYSKLHEQLLEALNDNNSPGLPNPGSGSTDEGRRGADSQCDSDSPE